MRYLTLVLMFFLSTTLSNAQINEIGVFLGGSNFIGDVGSTKYISPNQLAVGGVYKWNRSARHAYRVTLNISHLEGVDANSDDPRRQEREFSFNTSLLELGLGMEFNFLDFNLHNGGSHSSPYLYTGVHYIFHDSFYYNTSNEKINNAERDKTFAIPIILGFKTTLTEFLIAGFEIGARYTFSDRIDGSVPLNDRSNSQSFGNLNNNDWYMFSGVTLTYTFGRNPCFCPD